MNNTIPLDTIRRQIKFKCYKASYEMLPVMHNSLKIDANKPAYIGRQTGYTLWGCGGDYHFIGVEQFNEIKQTI